MTARAKRPYTGPVVGTGTLLRQPAVHFVALGAALFAIQGRLPGRPVDPAPARRDPIVITATQLAEMREEFTQRTGLVPTAADEAALVDGTVEDELFYREALGRGLDRDDRSVQHRLVEKMHALGPEHDADPAALAREALALGLDRDDPIIRRMLIEKMRLLAAATAAADDPGEAALQAFFAAHRDRYLAPARVSLRHVFLSARERGPRLARDAAALLRDLRRRQVVPGQPSR